MIGRVPRIRSFTARRQRRSSMRGFTNIIGAAIIAGLAAASLPANAQPLGNVNSGTYFSRYGSGEQGSNGWSHYDSMSGTSVGGDSNGCYYAGDWSNC